MIFFFPLVLLAYDILSDEEKRKNYDLYGDEKGSPGFEAGHPGDQSGYTYFTGGGPGQNQFTFRPGEWQNMGGQGGSRSFSFSFGGSGGPSSFGGSGGSRSFGFGMDDIFSNLFGGGFKGSQFGASGGATGSQSGSRSPSKSIRAINSQVYKKEIVDQGMTWLLFCYTTSLRGIQNVESIIEEVATSLQGALKVLALRSLSLFFFHLSNCLFIKHSIYPFCVFPLSGWKHKL